MLPQNFVHCCVCQITCLVNLCGLQMTPQYLCDWSSRSVSFINAASLKQFTSLWNWFFSGSVPNTTWNLVCTAVAAHMNIPQISSWHGTWHLLKLRNSFTIFTYDIIFKIASAVLQVKIYGHSSGTNHKHYHTAYLNAFSCNLCAFQLTIKVTVKWYTHFMCMPCKQSYKTSTIHIHSMKQILRTSYIFHKHFWRSPLTLWMISNSDFCPIW
jgi:hypothetical protein